MLRLPKNISIRWKLTWITLATCTGALVAGGGVLFAFQFINFQQTFKHDISVIADIIAKNSTAALAFQDDNSGRDILGALQATPQVVAAKIELPDGTVFANFGEADEMPAWHGDSPEGFLSLDGKLVLRHPIVLKNEQLGTLFLWSDYHRALMRLILITLGVVVAVACVSVLIAFLISTKLQHLISAPILQLANAARVIGEKNDYSIRVPKFADDEVGQFTEAFNHMLDEIGTQSDALQTARRKLADQVNELRYEIAERQRAEAALKEAHERFVEASRRAGMAEVATGVLHNVGNVLNSVNVSSGLIMESLHKSKAKNLSRATALLREHANDLPQFLASEKGRVLPGYLVEIGEHLAKERAEMLKEIELLQKNVEHIKDIVAMQQSYAKVSGLIEKLPVQALVDDAIEMDAASLEKHHIQLVREFQKVPDVAVDKHKVLQILINLIRNANHALKELDQKEKRIIVGISKNGGDRVKVTVTDNGVGIPQENLTRIFSHGFTTRKDGHGFGLHAGALAAQEIGGRLSAHSDGPGKGATFILELPIAKEKK